MKLFKNADRKTVSTGLAIALGAAFMLFVVLNFGAFTGWFARFMSYISSVLWGLAIAYIVRPFKKYVRAKLPKRIESEKIRNRISSLASLLLMILVIAFIFIVIIPRVFSSVSDFLRNFDRNLESFKDLVKRAAGSIKFYEVDEEAIDKFIGDSGKLLGMAAEWLQRNYDQVLGILTDVVNGIINFIIIVTIAAYALFDGDNIKRNTLRLERALFGAEKTERINSVIARGDTLMTDFLSSNIIDAIIIAVINFIFLTIMDAPYTLVLSVLLGMFNFVPTFGPIVGGIVASLIIVLTDPPLLLAFIIFTFVLQQLDGNLLKPLLFGDSTGLSGFWVMAAIVVGGKIFGILGMILGVPVVAFIATVLDDVLARVNGEDDLKRDEPVRRKFDFKKLFRKPRQAPKS